MAPEGSVSDYLHNCLPGEHPNAISLLGKLRLCRMPSEVKPAPPWKVSGRSCISLTESVIGVYIRRSLYQSAYPESFSLWGPTAVRVFINIEQIKDSLCKASARHCHASIDLMYMRYDHHDNVGIFLVTSTHSLLT